MVQNGALSALAWTKFGTKPPRADDLTKKPNSPGSFYLIVDESDNRKMNSVSAAGQICPRKTSGSDAWQSAVIPKISGTLRLCDGVDRLAGRGGTLGLFASSILMCSLMLGKLA